MSNELESELKQDDEVLEDDFLEGIRAGSRAKAQELKERLDQMLKRE